MSRTTGYHNLCSPAQKKTALADDFLHSSLMSPQNTSNQSISLWLQYFLQIGKEKYSQGNQLLSRSVLIITHLMTSCLNVKNPGQSAWKGSAACLAHLLLVFGLCTTRQLRKCKASVLWIAPWTPLRFERLPRSPTFNLESCLSSRASSCQQLHKSTSHSNTYLEVNKKVFCLDHRVISIK